MVALYNYTLSSAKYKEDIPCENEQMIIVFSHKNL